MPLPTAEEREEIHHRAINCKSFKRHDGLWDIEGRLVDTKGYSFKLYGRDPLPVGDALHDMSIRLTIDDDFRVHDVEAVIDSAPYSMCPNITENFKRIIGLSIAKGWRREVNKRVGGIQGCTHLVELLGPMATTAFQAIYPLQTKLQTPEPSVRPMLLNSCHAHATHTHITRRKWPDWYQEDENI